MPTARLFFAPRALLAAVVVTAVLSGCGGGGDEPSAGGGSTDTTQSASATGVVVVDDSARAQAALLRTTRAVVAVGTASQTVSCAGGGSALFTATAGSAGTLFNGVLDTGEAYSLQFNNCRSAAGAESITGLLTLSVISASGENLSVSTSTQAVVVGLPARTLTFDGSSTLTHTVQTTGSTQVITDRWVSPLISMTSLRNSRITSLTLSNVDLTHSETRSNGVPVGSSNEGTITIGYAGPVGHWTATIATQGVVSFDANGLPLLGLWQIILPHDLIGLQVSGGMALVTVDLGHNGSVDNTYTWPVATLTGEAG